MSRRIQLLATVVLTAAAACPLHDIADALENGRAAAAPHEWPYAAACAAYANVTVVDLPARFGNGRSAESEEMLSIDGSAPTSPV